MSSILATISGLTSEAGLALLKGHSHRARARRATRAFWNKHIEINRAIQSDRRARRSRPVSMVPLILMCSIPKRARRSRPYERPFCPHGFVPFNIQRRVCHTVLLC